MSDQTSKWWDGKRWHYGFHPTKRIKFDGPVQPDNQVKITLIESVDPYKGKDDIAFIVASPESVRQMLDEKRKMAMEAEIIALRKIYVAARNFLSNHPIIERSGLLKDAIKEYEE